MHWLSAQTFMLHGLKRFYRTALWGHAHFGGALYRSGDSVPSSFWCQQSNMERKDCSFPYHTTCSFPGHVFSKPTMTVGAIRLVPFSSAVAVPVSAPNQLINCGRESSLNGSDWISLCIQAPSILEPIVLVTRY